MKIPSELRARLTALGERIKAKRLSLGWSRSALAAKIGLHLDAIGYQTGGMIRGIEMGRTFMTMSLAAVIGDASIGEEYEAIKKEIGGA